MMPEMNMVQNDLKPDILATLLNCGSLAGATVRFIMADENGANVIDASASIVDATKKQVKYVWQAGDTDTVGTFYGEFEVTYSDTTTQSFPAKDEFVIRIRAEKD